jgi:hypothetical protein
MRIALIGAACGLAAGIVSLVIEFAVLAARARAQMPQDDSGGLGAVSSDLYAPYVAIVGFIVAVAWQWARRSR